MSCRERKIKKYERDYPGNALRLENDCAREVENDGTLEQCRSIGKKGFHLRSEVDTIALLI